MGTEECAGIALVTAKLARGHGVSQFSDDERAAIARAILWALDTAEVLGEVGPHDQGATARAWVVGLLLGAADFSDADRERAELALTPEYRQRFG